MQRTDKKRKTLDTNDAAPIDKDFIKRYQHAEFVTIPKLIKQEVTVADLLNLPSDSDNVDAVLTNPKIVRPKANNLPSDDEKMRALGGKVDHYFKATAMCGTVAIEVAGGACQNRRETMEDRYDVSKLSGIEHFDDSNFHIVAYETVRQLQIQCTDRFQAGGSTYLNVIIDLVNQRIVTTQLGDCTAWLYWIDDKNQPHLLALHDMVHNPDAPSEATRLLEAKHQVYVDPRDGKTKRLGGALDGLAVTRALGDHHLVNKGLLHVPTVTIKSYKHLIKKAKMMQVLLGTDGMPFPENPATNKAFNEPSLILQVKEQLIATERLHDNAALLAAKLPRAALPIHASALESNLSLTLCDGHATDRIAELATKKHYRIQQTVINQHIKEYKPWLIVKPLVFEPLNTLVKVPVENILATEDDSVEEAVPTHTASTSSKPTETMIPTPGHSSIWQKPKSSQDRDDADGLDLKNKNPYNY